MSVCVRVCVCVRECVCVYRIYLFCLFWHDCTTADYIKKIYIIDWQTHFLKVKLSYFMCPKCTHITLNFCN